MIGTWNMLFLSFCKDLVEVPWGKQSPGMSRFSEVVANCSRTTTSFLWSVYFDHPETSIGI